jgi:butyryl-CoA dehydrogenase
MPIDFTLTMDQKRLQADARAFARDVLTEVGPATRGLLTPLARFAATRPFYEQAISVIAVTGPAPGVVLERAIESIGHRAHLLPEFRLNGVRTSADNVIASVGGGKGLVEACFTGTAPIVGMFAVGLMRAAFDAALTFARTERRGGTVPIIEYQAVGYALADAKTAIEAVRTPELASGPRCRCADARRAGARAARQGVRLETAVRIITDLMRVVGVDSYDHDMPLGGLLVDALVLPLFDGGNMGVRRRQLHDLMRAPGYDPLATAG